MAGSIGLPRTNPDGSVTLRSSASGPLVTVPGLNMIPSSQDVPLAARYVDFEAGNDNNDGLTPSSAFRTFRYGLSPKLNGKAIPGTLQVFQLSSAPVDDVYWANTFQSGSEQGALEVYGTPTIVYRGTITAATLAATGTRAQLTIAGADLTPYVGKRIRIESGTNVGAVGYIQALASPSAAWINQPYMLDGFATGQFRVGDTIVVETLVQSPAWVGINTQRWEGRNPNYFQSLLFGRPGFGGAASYIPIGPASFDICQVNTAWLDLKTLVYFNGCSVFANSGEVSFTGYVACTNCSLFLTSVVAQNLEVSRCVQVGRGLTMISGTLQTRNYFQFWDWPNGPAVTFLTGSSGSNVGGRISGTSTAAGTYGMLLRPGVVYSYLAGSSNRPSVAGAAAYNVDIAGTQVLWAAVPATVNAARFAGVVEYNT